MNGKGFSSLPVTARGAIIVCALAALVAVTYLMVSQQEWAIGRLALLVALGAAIARKKVQLMSSSVSLLTSIVLLAVMTDGPAAAVIVAVCGVISQTVQSSGKLVAHQALFNASMIAITAGISGVAYQAIVGVPGFADDVLGMLLASMTYFIGNSAFVAMIIGLSQKTSIARTWWNGFANTAPSFLIGGLMSLVMLQLLANAAVLVVLMAMLFPIYYSSIRLATRSA